MKQVLNFHYYGYTKEQYDSCQNEIQNLDYFYIRGWTYFGVIIALATLIYHNLTDGVGIEIWSSLFLFLAIAAAFFTIFKRFLKKTSAYCFYIYAILGYVASIPFAMDEPRVVFFVVPSVVVVSSFLIIHYATPLYILVAGIVISNIVLFTPVFGPDYVFHRSIGEALFWSMTLVIQYLVTRNRIGEILQKRSYEEIQKELEEKMIIDSLSTVLTRDAFIAFLEGMIKKADGTTAFCIIDLDHFKAINDTYGHQFGDDAIRATGLTLRECFSDPEKEKEVYNAWNKDLKKGTVELGNCVGRLGGDEFLLFLTNAGDKNIALAKVEAFVDKLNHTAIGPLNSIEASVGVTFVEPTDHNFDDVYTRADMALYSAKDQLNIKVCAYENGMEKNVEEEQEEYGIDRLTGLIRSDVFSDRFSKMLKKQEIFRLNRVLLYIDIDNFKHYNTKYSFAEGDRILRILARYLQVIFPGNLFTRISADHFAGFTEDVDLRDKINKLNLKIQYAVKDATIRVRVGVYQLDGTELNHQAMLNHAKFACDQVRKSGESLCYFDEQLAEKAKKEEYIIGHIVDAINKGHIRTYFHPVVRTITRELCSAEALARWQDPQYGFLSPADFVPILEKNRLIDYLDRFIIQDVCKNIRVGLDAGMQVSPISINLSRLDFELFSVYDYVENTVEKYHIPKNLIYLEITESFLVEEPELIRKEIFKFQNAGYQIWLDDFGSGYSSLNVLKDYHFDMIKFDMKFLRDFSETSKTILASMVDMAKQLKLPTLAEGVETEEQFAFLCSIGCEKAQGFLFGKPQTLEGAIERILNEVIPIENYLNFNYYEKVSSVNLINPVSNGKNGYEEVAANRLPVAMFENRDGELYYLALTESCLQLMRGLHFDVTPGEKMFQQRDSARLLPQLLEVSERAKESGKVEHFDFVEQGVRCYANVRVIAVDENRNYSSYIITPYLEGQKV